MSTFTMKCCVVQFFPHLERVPVWSLLLALARPSPSSSYLGFEMIFPLKEFFHRSTEKRAPVPRHIGLRPIGEHLLLLASSVLAGPHRLLDWVHPGWGRLLCQTFVSQFYFRFGLELKEQQHPSNNICCLSKMIYLCLLKLFY